VAAKIWLSRTVAAVDGNSNNNSSSTTSGVACPWTPLRKKDCQALNEKVEEWRRRNGGVGDDDEPLQVYLEEGRSTATLSSSSSSSSPSSDATGPSADLDGGVICYNFYRGDQRQLCSAIWFRKEEKKKNEYVLHPLYQNRADADAIEALYQTAVRASSSLGEGVSSVVNTGIELSDGTKVTIVRTSGSLKLVWKETGWFGSQYDLQRGYGEYAVDGEEEETMLAPVGHLCFVIHGIGEAFFANESNKQMSLVEQMNSTRIALHKRQVKEWRAECDRARKRQDLVVPEMPRRIEVIPIEWYNRLHDESTTLMRSLQSTTLRTIPLLRAIANDVIFDVLLYLTPTFCEAVIECVTDQICQHHAKFCQVHPEFSSSSGSCCSLVGHSLGSVIAWDLLSILKDTQGDSDASTTRGGVTIAMEDAVEVGYQAYATQASESFNAAQHGTWGPTLTKRMDRTIPFTPDCTIFLGSPLGIFLTLRGAHPVFDEMRAAAVEQVRLVAKASPKDGPVRLPSASPFTLPTNSLYNIFHACVKGKLVPCIV